MVWVHGSRDALGREQEPRHGSREVLASSILRSIPSCRLSSSIRVPRQRTKSAPSRSDSYPSRTRSTSRGGPPLPGDAPPLPERPPGPIPGIAPGRSAAAGSPCRYRGPGHRPGSGRGRSGDSGGAAAPSAPELDHAPRPRFPGGDIDRLDGMLSAHEDSSGRDIGNIIPTALPHEKTELCFPTLC